MVQERTDMKLHSNDISVQKDDNTMVAEEPRIILEGPIWIGSGRKWEE